MPGSSRSGAGCAKAPAATAERADTSRRKLPRCGTQAAARLRQSRRRRGDAGCSPDPAPRQLLPEPGAHRAAHPHRLPRLLPGERPAPGTVPSRQGAAGAAPARSLPGGAAASFPVPPAGSAAGPIRAPPRPLPRAGGSRGPAGTTSPGSSRTGTGSSRRPPAPLTAPPSGGGRNRSRQRSSFKVLPEAGEGVWEGGASPATAPEAGRVAVPATYPPRGPSACRSDKFCAQDTTDTRFSYSAFVRVYTRNRFPTPPWTPSGRPGLTRPGHRRPAHPDGKDSVQDGKTFVLGLCT